MALFAVQPNTQPPRISGIVTRPRLLEILKSAFEHKLTLLCAPPGYGKTTVVTQFIAQTAHRVAWHTIEERERDLPNLMAQSLAVLEQLAPGILSLNDKQGYTPKELATLIAHYLRDQIPYDFFYILDDVHNLASSTAAETWLRTLVNLMPSNCHLILISRILPNLPLTEMIARREVLAIGQNQLRFTFDEIKTLAHTLGLSLPADQVQELATRLEGWPAGTVLALQPLPPDLERFMLQGGAGPEALFDALAEVTLQTQPPGLRDFLLASSTLARLTPELCATVLHIPDSAEWLTQALNHNLFLSRAAGGFVYHRLFRNFLQRQLELHHLDWYLDLHLRAARWSEANDQLEEAFDHYLNANVIGGAVKIAERVAQTYFAQGKVETLLRWNARLNQLDAIAPRLLLACAKIHTDRYDYQSAEFELEKAESAFQAQTDEVALADIKLQRARCSLQCGHYEEAIVQATELLQSALTEAKIRGRALRTLGFAYMRLGNAKAALESLEAALPLYRSDGDAHALSQLLQDLVMIYWQLGHHQQANACLQEVVALRRSLGSPSALALALNNLGYYYHRCSDYQQALVTLQEGLSVVANVPDKRAESYLRWSFGDLKRDLGAFEEAQRSYNKALELIGSGDPALSCSILTSISTLCRWQGKNQEAVSLAQEALTLATTHKIALEGHLARAALQIAQAQIEPTVELIVQLKAISDDLYQQQAQLELLQVLGWYIHAALLFADKDAAVQSCRLALQIAQEVGTAQPLAVEAIYTTLIEEFLTAHSAKYSPILRDVKRLAEAQLKIPASEQTRHLAHIDYFPNLRVYTLGQENIERNGEKISSSDWRATAAKELFLYLLFQGPTAREDISLAFWPDSPPKVVRSNFHTTLYRARQALGEQVIAFEDSLYFISPEFEVWCDANEFELLIQQARLLSPRDARTEDLWRKAVSLYKGDFLPGLDAEWVTTRRETLHEACLEAIIGLGNCARARRANREALAVYKNALAIDPYREDVYRAIMNCYAELGEKGQILVHLQQLQRIFRQELAIEPSRETLSLARTLLQ